MGFETVARHPGLIIIPTLLDLFLWLGPRLSFAPLFQTMAQMAQTMGLNTGEEIAALQQLLADLGERLNGFILAGPAPLLSLPTLLFEIRTKLNLVRGWDQNSLGVPSLLAEMVTSGRPLFLQSDIAVSTSLAALGWGIGIIVVGMLLNAYYLRSIGQRVVEENEIELPRAQSPLRLWGQLLQLMFVLTLVLFSVSVLMALLVTIMKMIPGFFSKFISAFFLSTIFFVSLHMVFVVPGIVLLRRGLLQAIHESLILVRSDFLSAILLLLLLFVIARGFNVVWTMSAPTSWTMLVSIVGHAFVSTSLTAALFIFYQDRLHFLEIFIRSFAHKDVPVAGK